MSRYTPAMRSLCAAQSPLLSVHALSISHPPPQTRAYKATAAASWHTRRPTCSQRPFPPPRPWRRRREQAAGGACRPPLCMGPAAAASARAAAARCPRLCLPSDFPPPTLDHTCIGLKTHHQPGFKLLLLLARRLRSAPHCTTGVTQFARCVFIFFRRWQAKRQQGCAVHFSATGGNTGRRACAAAQHKAVAARGTRVLAVAQGPAQRERHTGRFSSAQGGVSADTTTGWTRETGWSVPQCRQVAGSKAARGRQQGGEGQWRRGGGSACDAAAGVGVQSSTKGSPGRGVGRRRGRIEATGLSKCTEAQAASRASGTRQGAKGQQQGSSDSRRAQRCAVTTSF